MRAAIVTFILALSGCIGYGPFISPAKAYRLEVDSCKRKANGDAEELRKCLGHVERRYHRYNSEGGYPAYPAPPPVR